LSTNNDGAAAVGGAPSVGPAEGKEPDQRRPWSAGRIVTLVVGCLLLLGSLGIGAAGGVLAVADKGLRDGQGFFMSGEQSLSSTGYAVASERVELHLVGTGRFVPDRFLGDVKVTVSPRGDAPVFVGIAPAADAAKYLAGVQHSVLLDLTSRNGQGRDPVYRQVAGGSPALTPVQTNIWAARASGPGKQSVVWSAEPGDWAVVVMNADGTSPVSADVAVGATFPGIGLVIGILLVVAGCLFVLAIILMVVALRARRRRSRAQGSPVGQAAGS
jgi:hypothetical protein